MSDQSLFSDNEKDSEENQANLRHRRAFNASEAADDTLKQQLDTENLTALQVCSMSSEYYLVDSSGNELPSNLQINSQLRGRFSQPDKITGAEHRDVLELIFYRRNKFKVVGTVFIPAGVAGVRAIHTGSSLQITSLHAELDATESLEGSDVRVLQLLPKDKTIQIPGRGAGDSLCKVDLAYRGPTTEQTTVPVAWEKLQFRHATAKKRGTWQYFYLRVRVTAQLEDGSSQTLCQARSAAITVRGRSPQSFPDTNKSMSRPAKQVTTAMPKSGNDDSNVETDANLGFQIDCSIPASDNLFFYDFSDLGIWNENLQWHDESNDGENQNYSGIGVSSPVSDNHNGNESLLIPSIETSLLPSIPDLESIFNLPNPLSGMSMDSMQLFQNMNTSDSAGIKSHNATDDGISDEEERSTYSYEYIPLSINDWTVPVDAVYRPHGVHAQKVPSTGQSVTKKRYFMAVN
ncbi:hypothetical protein BGW36DRAFT_381550 [Talaromyces proteolyticus]|uniref:NDT80 domain-containing protein n=1 Tax=Talaromyces proteolyticus TaxID=1131652 RepID=A0AAD4PVP3_9EURO|nr:uncharacterized protein BGW36DRAFT_381550 [Talaromyces proteolyticus]KAH8696740.1 hypothetical protein BGW36DRAFT_381550 [Talaromyces proteolyticus]